MVNEGQVCEGDLLVCYGCIECIVGCLENCGVSWEIDVVGCYLLLGMIDDQVYFCELGYLQKGLIVSEFCVVVVGGIISFMDMFNICLVMLSFEVLVEKKCFVVVYSVVNYGFYFGVSCDNFDIVVVFDLCEVVVVKVFMGVFIGDMLVDDLLILECLFVSVLILLLSYCEDMLWIEVNLVCW